MKTKRKTQGKEQCSPMLCVFHNVSKHALLLSNADADAVLVVLGEGLLSVALAVDNDLRAVNAVLLHQTVGNDLGAVLTEALVDLCVASALVSIASHIDLGLRVELQESSNLVKLLVLGGIGA